MDGAMGLSLTRLRSANVVEFLRSVQRGGRGGAGGDESKSDDPIAGDLHPECILQREFRAKKISCQLLIALLRRPDWAGAFALSAIGLLHFRAPQTNRALLKFLTTAAGLGGVAVWLLLLSTITEVMAGRQWFTAKRLQLPGGCVYSIATWAKFKRKNWRLRANEHPPELKPRSSFAAFMARLKPCPCKTDFFARSFG
jgi:hypothetical protein